MTEYSRPIKLGDEIVFNSVWHNEDAITLGKVYKIVSPRRPWAQLVFIDDDWNSREWPLTSPAQADERYSYEILVLENE